MTTHDAMVELAATVWLANDADFDIEQAKRYIALERAAGHSGDCTNQPWTCSRCVVDEAFKNGRLLIAAINASGIAWVAPWEATDAMHRAARESGGSAIDYAEMRDAHLAEQESKD